MTKTVVINRPITRIVTINRGLSGQDALPANTDALTEGSTNLYFTAARAKAAAVADSITDGVTDVAPSQNAVHDALALKLDSSAYNQHYLGTYTSLANLQAAHPSASLGDYAIVDAGPASNALQYIWDAADGWVPSGSTGPATTDALSEGSTNLYFTAARVRDVVLTGLSTATNAAITAADSVLSAFGKLQAQVSVKFNSSDVDPDATMTANSDAKVASQKATKTALDLKANLNFANFQDLEIGARKVAGYSYGTNVNGDYFIYYNKNGDIIKVVQNWIALSSASAAITRDLPIAMPDQYYSMPAGTADTGGGASAAVGIATTKTSAQFALNGWRVDTGARVALTFRGTATWIKP